MRSARGNRHRMQRFPAGIIAFCSLPVVHIAAIFVWYLLGIPPLVPGDFVETRAGSTLPLFGRANVEAEVIGRGQGYVLRTGGQNEEGNLLVLGIREDGRVLAHWEAAKENAAPSGCGRSADLLLPASGVRALRRASLAEDAVSLVAMTANNAAAIDDLSVVSRE